MKKIILLLITLLCLASCSKKEEQIVEDYAYSNMGILVPTGAPSLAFISCVDDETFETNTNPNNIVSQMNEASNKHVVVLETITGINAIKKGAPYKLLGTITFGNYYLAATGNDKNATLDKDDNIVVFGSTQEKLFDLIYDKTNFNIEMVAGVSEAGKCLAMGKNLETGNDIDYVLMAEPALSKILNNKEVPTYGKSYTYADIQIDYKKKVNEDIFQASIFIKDDGYISNVDDYCLYLEENITNILNDVSLVDTYLKNKDDEEVSMIFGIDKETIKTIFRINSINLGFKKASEYKEDINDYYKLFTGEEIDEEIFAE